MSDLLDGLTPLRVLPKRIDADCYNRIRVRLLRSRRLPIRVTIPDHRGLEMILTHRAWLCLDAYRDDLPIISWSEFETKARTGLDEPVMCRLCLYHIHAGMIMGSALEALADCEWELVRH
ncbi:hypothetical protein [Thiohalorhabdus methylotrophus]|uniref:Uncharacterized protein n=1 Tax=Thiohalorhabdus methylotrophus TaxID=3242694 RepID=A0ABV4TZ36_9GAMM